SLIQPILAKHVSVPILTSPLIMVPVIHQMMPPDQSVAIVVASKKLLTAEYFEAIGADITDRIVVVGLDDAPVFNSFCMGGKETGYDIERFREEICQIVEDALAKHPDIGAIMLECTSLPPFAADVRDRTGLPVYDFIACVEWMHRAVVPKRYQGFI
ncbi:MAG: hypothetical protein ACR2PF_21530, partial [Rhizobiaceae bacterium]